MKEYQKRYYQSDAINAAISNIEKNIPRSLVTIPTGGGKTLVISSIVNALKDRQILIITPRKKLLEQTVKWLNDDGTTHKVIIGTYQTLIKRDFVAPDVILVDEAHLVPDDLESSYKHLIDRFNVPVVGFTATPVRGKKSLLESDWLCCHETSIFELIESRYLVPPRSIAVGSHSVVDATDISLNEVTDAILPKLLRSFKKQGITSPIIFCANIEHATHVIQQLHFLSRKNVVLIHSKLSPSVISERWSEYENGNCILVNVQIATIGVDVPRCDAIVLLRNVTSYAMFAQIVGRGLRIADGKTHCCVYDYGDATKLFGNMIFENISSSTTVSSNALKACPICESHNLIHTQICINCGFEFTFKTHINLDTQTSELLGNDYSYNTVSEITNVNGVSVGLLDDGYQVHSTKENLKIGQTLLCKKKIGSLKEIVIIVA